MKTLVSLLGLFAIITVQAQTWKKYNNSNSGLGNNTVHSLDYDSSSNTLWIGGSNYLNSFQNDLTWDTISSVMPNNSWYAVKVVAQGDLWVGGDDNCRLYHISGSNITEYTDSINSIGEIRSIEEDAHGNIWVGTTFGLRMYNGARWFNYSDSILNEGIWTMELGFDSLMWFGSWSEGIFKYDGQKFTNYNSQNSPMPSAQVRSLSKGVYPNLWIGTRDGLLRFDGDTTWNHWTENNSQLYDNEVYALAVDNDSVTWIGPNGGSRITTYDSTGWDNNSRVYPFNSISFTHAITITPGGMKYFGGQGGVVSLSDGRSGPIQAPVRNQMGPLGILSSDLNHLEVYPNPSSGKFRISGMAEQLEYRILNISGATMASGKIQSKDILSLPDASGIYFIELIDGTERVIKRLIKK